MAGTTTYYGISYPTSTDYVKDGATAIQTVATGFDSAVAIPTYNAQTGTTYTFALTDVGKTVTASNAASQTYTIPPTASVAWAANTTLRVLNLGAGVVTFAAGAGVTVTNTAQTLAQYQSANLVRTGLNAWTVVPTSGSASAGTSGLILINTTTFSAVSSQSVPASTFTSTYKNYQVVFRGTQSTQIDLNVRVRASGTDLTGSVYKYSTMFNTSDSATYSTQNSASATQISLVGGGVQSAYYIFDINDIFEAKRTAILWRGQMMISSADNSYNMVGAAQVYNTNSYDSLTLFPGSGTITGTLAVYGRPE